MLTQRIICQSWQKILSKSLNSKSNLPQARQQNYVQMRPIRTSYTFRNLSRSNSLQPSPPVFENCIYGGSVPPGNIVKALVFTGAFSVGCFMGATILEYENTRNMILEKARNSKLAWLRRRPVTENNPWQNLKSEVQRLWGNLTQGEKVFVPICALNLLVFGLWRVPSMRRTMMTYFCSNPAGQAVCWPMFLSTFSHYSAFHIFANMYVLHSFVNVAVLSLGKEQFLALYLSAGVIASLTSILYKAITRQAGLSIGASGAIMTILAYVCSKYPDTQLNILFLPMLTFSAGSAIKVIMGIDLAGCLLGWKFFDHAAHLGGAAFGVFWAYFGAEMWQKRMPFLTMYHDLRKTK